MRDAAVESLFRAKLVGSMLAVLLAGGCATDADTDDAVQDWHDAMNHFGDGAKSSECVERQSCHWLVFLTKMVRFYRFHGGSWLDKLTSVG